MEYLFAGIGILLFLFGFLMGSKLSLRASRGIEPRSPIQYVKDKIREKENEKIVQQDADEWQKIEDCDGYTEEERKIVNGREKDG